MLAVNLQVSHVQGSLLFLHFEVACSSLELSERDRVNHIDEFVLA